MGTLKISLNGYFYGRSLLKWFAPILAFTTEEIYQLISKKNKSIHLEKFINFPKKFENSELNNRWKEILKIRDICNLSIEEKRASKEIGSSLEADIVIKLNSKFLKLTKNIDFAELCITSKSITKEDNNAEVIVETRKANGTKCSICWKIKTKACERATCPISR